MDKANGENIQVTCYKGRWLVCSKNVSLLVGTRVEIDQAIDHC